MKTAMEKGKSTCLIYSRLEEAVDTLSEIDHDIIVLFLLEQASMSWTASETGLDQSRGPSRIAKALFNLVESYRQLGINVSITGLCCAVWDQPVDEIPKGLPGRIIERCMTMHQASENLS